MAIQFPENRKEIETRARADVRAQLPSSNPWLKNSFIGALVTGISGRVYEFYLQLKNALLEMFPDTATGEYLARWGSYVNIIRKSAMYAQGNLAVTGTAGTLVPLGASFQANGVSYVNTTPVAITATSVSILSITRTGQTATATTSAAHGLASGLTVTISGATQPEYTGDFQITVLSETTFSYQVVGTPVSPATGTLSLSIDMATVFVQAQSYGLATNLSEGSPVSLSSPIAGIDGTAYVPLSAISGGADIESNDAYRERVLYRYRNPVAQFNKSQITLKALETPAVTRVWVNEAGAPSSALSVASCYGVANAGILITFAPHLVETGQVITVAGASPAAFNRTTKALALDAFTLVYSMESYVYDGVVATGTVSVQPGIANGQVKVFFTTDNDEDIIPSAGLVDEIRAAILALKPAHVSADDVLVAAPTAVTTNFVFSSLSPNTVSMQDAIRASLRSLFRNDTNVSENLEEAAYLAAIWQTVSANGERVKSFTLSSPTTSISASIGYLPVLGTITFP